MGAVQGDRCSAEISEHRLAFAEGKSFRQLRNFSFQRSAQPRLFEIYEYTAIYSNLWPMLRVQTVLEGLYSTGF